MKFRTRHGRERSKRLGGPIARSFGREDIEDKARVV